MASIGFEQYFPSTYKRRVVVRTAGFGSGGGIGSRSAYSSHSAPILSYASSRRSFPTHTRAISSYSSVLSVPLSLGTAEPHQVTQINSEFKVLRTQEKAELQDLNNRFVSFIERVHELEQQNKVLQADLLLLRQRQTDPSNLRALYEHEIHQLCAALDEARHEKQAAQDHRDRKEDMLRNLQKQYENEVLGREEAEGRLMDARKGAAEAALRQTELEKRLRNLLDELEFLKHLFEHELTELQAQIQYSTEVSVKTETSKPDLSAALCDIRGQYEKLAQQNLQSAEEWFCTKMNVMAASATRDTESMRNAKDEASEYRQLLKSKSLEIDTCREINDALENQIQEVEERQSGEVSALQDTINQLEDELRATKNDMARYHKDYQDLLNVKMALDIEIAAYRKLLEGEESRLNVATGPTSISVYSQKVSYAAPPYGRTSHLLSSRFQTLEEMLTASRALEVEASPPQEEDKEDVEEEVEDEEEEKDEGGKEEAEEDEEDKGGEEEKPGKEEEEEPEEKDGKSTD